MLTLGIETSCDETSCAVLLGRNTIKSNIVSSSLFQHQPFGGVVPEIASRHCLEQIDVVYEQALKKAGVKTRDIDLIAVTRGPGLIGSLLVGICFGKTLSYQLGVPLVGVNHLEAHLAANFIGQEEPERYLGLLVSGGHTSVSLHEKGQMKFLGETMDDACGEAYDKVAKLLGLGYPGGPVLDRLAQEGNPKAFSFTKPKLEKPYDFSFSGVKTAVLYLVRKQSVISPDFQRDMAASFQKAAVGWLVDAVLQAAETWQVQSIAVGGGVSANSELRRQLTEKAAAHGLRVMFPPMALTGDNGAMIARRGLDLFRAGVRDSSKMTGDPGLRPAAAC